MNTMFDFFDVNAVQIGNVTEARRKEDWECELKRRIQIEKARKELPVYYYRIYRRCFFELPVKNGWQDTLPVIVENIKPYPWEIWLMWSLRERWDTLMASAVLYEDKEAVTLLETELDAAFEWETYAIGTDAYLGTAHFAMCVYRYLKSAIFSEETCRRFKVKAWNLLDKHFLPWFEKFSKEDHSNLVVFMHNIPVIMVFSGLALAKELKHPKTEAIENIANEMMHIFAGSKAMDKPFTEMAAYDAFALDSMTEYWEKNDSYAEYVDLCREDLLDSMYSFIDTAVPGRADLLAPLGDVETQMQFHSLVLLRISEWLQCEEATRAFCMIPAERLPATALLDAICKSVVASDIKEKNDYTRKNAGSIVMRSGKGENALMCAVATATWPEQHVHYDAGSFVFATKGCFIITDPGYQQYIKGEERQFTIGTYSHNAPIINGQEQKVRNCKILKYSEGYVLVDITKCYTGLEENAVVLRELKLDGESSTLTITDIFKNLNHALIEHSYTISPDFAVTVTGETVRLSNGSVSACLMCNTPFLPENALCNAGSNERLRLIHTENLSADSENKIVFKLSIEN